MNSLAHYRDVKQLNGIIDSYEKKLDQKVNQMFNHIINLSNNINEVSLPVIENKRLSAQSNYKQTNFLTRKVRTQSIGSKSFVINNDLTINQQITQADSLFKTFKDKMQKSTKQKKSQNSLIIPLGSRSIGGQTYAKPKITRKKPQILSKQMRWDPFYQKNAIKAQQLKQGMLSLIQKGKVGKNIDIITAFEKGRPILEAHQAIFHHAQEKFTDSDLIKSQINPSQKTIKKQVNEGTYNRRRNLMPTQDDHSIQYNNNANNSWAITIPEDSNFRPESKSFKKTTFLNEDIGQLYCIEFLHYKLKKDQNFKKIKKYYKFHQHWGEFMEIINEIQKQLKKFNIQLVFFSANKILQLAKRRESLIKIQIQDLQLCVIKNENQQAKKKKKIFNLLSIKNKQKKTDLASVIVTSAFLYTLVRHKYMSILKRKKYQNKIKQWILNGLIIKDYRRQLQKSRQTILAKFQEQQKIFRSNFSTIQQKKHYQIHVVNRQFMNKFKYYQQYCCTQITRIFNLQNNNTNIIYVSPFQLNVQTINYYFKIMELQQIENYTQRVTFLELQDITSKIKLPHSMNTSQKLYFNSKALRKLKRKIEGVPAYFVTNYPSQIDIKLSVYLGVPIYTGNFHQINPIRSELSTQRFSFQGFQTAPNLSIAPKQFNVFQLSNVVIKYCEPNKKCRKYVIKINNHHFSSGLALLAYPFSSLHQMYSNTALVQPFYFKSIQKFYSQLVRQGGIIQRYQQGTKTLTVCAKLSNNQQHTILGTFQKLSIGFVNVGYIFPQKLIPHKLLINKCNQVFERLNKYGHIGYVQLTLSVNLQQKIYLQQIELYSTKITNSLYYFKFLAGGYLNSLGQFMTKISPEGEQDEQIVSMQSRSYCYIPFILHFGLSQKQTGSFFQLCRIGGISFDLESKYGTTFIILGSLKDTMGIITTAKDRKNILKLITKSAEFLIKQNSHNISTQMLKEKQERSKERFSINSIKDKIQQL